MAISSFKLFWKIKDIKQNLEHKLCVEAHYSLIKFEIWKSIDKLIFVVNETKNMNINVCLIKAKLY